MENEIVESKEKDSFVESGGFNVQDIPASQDFEPENLRHGFTEDLQPQPDPVITAQVNSVLIETACVMISKLAVALTGFEEIGLDEDEIAQLVKLWTPFTPSMSPFSMAIVGTTMILASKTFLYLHLRKQQKLLSVSKSASIAIIEGDSGKTDKTV